MKTQWIATVYIDDTLYCGEPRRRKYNAAASACREVLKKRNLGDWKTSFSNIYVVEKVKKCQASQFYLKKETNEGNNSELSFEAVLVYLENKRSRKLHRNLSKSFGKAGILPWRSSHPATHNPYVDTPIDIRKSSSNISEAKPQSWITRLHDLGQNFSPDVLKIRFDQLGCSIELQNSNKKVFVNISKEEAAHEAYQWIVSQFTKKMCEVADIKVDFIPDYYNRVQEQCFTAAKQLCYNHLEPLHKDDVIAAIIMTQPGKTAKIVSIGIGNGFIHWKNIVEDGTAIIDSHAEVLARRGFEAFLMKAISDKDQIVQKRKERYMYSLKEGVEFHLFVSKVPCGNATLPTQSEDRQLRYRKEASQIGHGILDIETSQRENSDKLHLMCCSAKIALWNVVGIQGALLSRVLEKPIYLSTIIVRGGNEASLKRAFCDRISGIGNLQGAYKVNEPKIISLPETVLKVAVKDTAAKGKYAFSWNSGTEGDEDFGGMSDTTTGKVLDGDICITKKNLLKSWNEIRPNYDKYGNSKKYATSYMSVKEIFRKYCLEKRLGKWIAIPKEVDQFSLVQYLL